MDNNENIEVMVVSTNGISSMCRGIVTALEAKDIVVGKLDTRTAKIDEYHKLGNIVVLITDNMEVVTADMVAKECVKQGVRIIIIGAKQQNANIRKVISSAYLAGEFDRPVVINEFADEVERVLRKDNVKKKQLLIIDDQPVFLRTAMEWFKDKYKVSVAPSITKGMKIIENSKPDAVLLDYEMPTIAGDRAFSMISKNPKYSNIPIIFLTSQSDREIVHRLIDLKPAGYILKTETSEKIVAYVDRFFAKR